MRFKNLLKKLPGFLAQVGTIVNVVTTATGVNPFGLPIIYSQLVAMVGSTVVPDKYIPEVVRKPINLMGGNFGKAENDVEINY